MNPLVAAWLAIAVAALPLTYGLWRVFFRNGINADMFASVCEKIILAGNPDRFLKLVASAGEVPLAKLVRYVWDQRHPPAMAMPDFDGYRQAGPTPSYLERLQPVIASEVEAARRELGRAAWWTLAGLVPLPVLALLLQRPTLEAPWIVAAVMALLTARTFVTAQKQRNQVNRTLERLVPLFEAHANTRA